MEKTGSSEIAFHFNEIYEDLFNEQHGIKYDNSLEDLEIKKLKKIFRLPKMS